MFDRIKSFFKFGQKVNAKKWRLKRRVPKFTAGLITKDKPIQYFLNDPSTPELIKEVTPPEPYNLLNYSVHEYLGGGYDVGSPEGKAANVYVTITDTLNMIKKYTDKPLARWAGTRNLPILPLAGGDFNAFYNRVSIQFFFAYDHVDNQPIFTCDSADIVSHELGHAILDSYRPDTWGAASLEIWSFHESWADLTALLAIMQHDEVLKSVLKETNGNLRNQSVMSRLAETMGRAIYNITKGDGGRPKNYLRTAINDFKYVNPGTLPENAPHNELAAECHSFGRVFLGAFYDMIEAFYQDGLKNGKGELQALRDARDVMGRYAYKAIQHAPLNVKFYESIAKTLLWVAWNEPNHQYHEEIRNILMNRNLVKPEIRMLSAPPVDQDGDGIVASGEISVLKLSEHIIRAQSQNDNELYDVEVVAPKQEAYFYDLETGIAIDQISSSDDEVLGALQDMIIYLHKIRGVSDDDSTPFAVKDGKLVRTHFS